MAVGAGVNHRAHDFDIGEVVFIGGTLRAVVLFLHSEENEVTVQTIEGVRRRVKADKLIKMRKCCGGS